MADPTSSSDLVVLRGIRKHYPVTRGLLQKTVSTIKAVDGIDIAIRKGETLGLVGESGCGKSTMGRVILRLEEPTEGDVLFDGSSILSLSRKELRRLRRRMQIIFQDPYSSLDPRQTIGRIIGEGLTIHNVGTATERKERVRYLMEVAGLRPELINRYPHEFSGGQRQRIGIARALALNPEFIICDEPLSSLDVSIQAQIINLLQDLQEEYRLTYLFISHDLSVVRHISDRVAVMYLGALVELADKNELFDAPLHPYTRMLLEAIPNPDPEARRKRIRRETEATEGGSFVPGCRFSPACPVGMPRCRVETPLFTEHKPGHWVKCFLYGGSEEATQGNRSE